MFFHVLSQVSTLSILLPCLTGMVRFTGVDPVHRPFFLFIWIGTINEAISYSLVHFYNGYNSINSNAYHLCEYLAILLVFFRWDQYRTVKKYMVLSAAGIVAWPVDNLLFHSIRDINAVSRIFYSLVILLLSIQQVTRLIVSEKRSLVQNTMFGISTCFAFYFSYIAFIETFYILHPPFSDSFNLNLFTIPLFVNLFTNISYMVIILCMPSKTPSTLR